MPDIDWTKFFVVGFAVLAMMNVVFFIALFGWAAIAILVILLLIGVIGALSLMVLRANKIMSAIEEAINATLVDLDRIGDEFSKASSEMPWMEDVPQVRKMAKLLYDAKYALLSLPQKFNNRVRQSINLNENDLFESDRMVGEGDGPVEDPIPVDTEFLENLKREIAAREANRQPSNNARPIG